MSKKKLIMFSYAIKHDDGSVDEFPQIPASRMTVVDGCLVFYDELDEPSFIIAPGWINALKE